MFDEKASELKIKQAMERWYQETNLRNSHRVSAKERRFFKKGSLLTLKPNLGLPRSSYDGKKSPLFLDETFMVLREPRFISAICKPVLLRNMCAMTFWYIPSVCFADIGYASLKDYFLYESTNEVLRLWSEYKLGMQAYWVNEGGTQNASPSEPHGELLEAAVWAGLRYSHSFYRVTLVGSLQPFDVILKTPWDPGAVFRKLRAA